MITKQQAMELPKGSILEHVEHTNKDKTPMRCRIMGKCKIWVTRPEEFRLPVKHGMYDAFYITEMNNGEWNVQT